MAYGFQPYSVAPWAARREFAPVDTTVVDIELPACPDPVSPSPPATLTFGSGAAVAVLLPSCPAAPWSPVAATLTFQQGASVTVTLPSCP